MQSNSFHDTLTVIFFMGLFISSIHFSSLPMPKLKMSSLSKSLLSTYSGNGVFSFYDQVLLGDGIVGALNVELSIISFCRLFFFKLKMEFI